MTLVRWDPFRELEDMSERLNRVFSRPTLRNTGKENLTVADWMPTVDISENESEYLIKAELPEVRKEDVKVTVENGVLTFRENADRKRKRRGGGFIGSSARTEALSGVSHFPNPWTKAASRLSIKTASWPCICQSRKRSNPKRSM